MEGKQLTCNDTYWYQDDDINTYVNIMISQLGGYSQQNTASYLLNEIFPEDGNPYVVLVTPAIDTYELAAPIDFYFNREAQPAPDPGNIDHRRDIFDEMLPLLESQDERFIKILFPYNVTQTHWLTGEITIHKTNDSCEILIGAHDPYGNGEITPENYQVLAELLRTRLGDIGIENIDCQRVVNPCERRQAEGDSSSCGVIVADEMIKRIKGQSLICPTHPAGALELRQQQLSMVQQALSNEDPSLKNFIKHTTLQQSVENHSKTSQKTTIPKNTLFRLNTQIFQNNILLIEAVQELLTQLKESPNNFLRAPLIKQIYDVLMSIPYKYGRINLEKTHMGSPWEDGAFITKVGLPYLVKELTDEHEYSWLTAELIKEINDIFPLIIENFLIFQHQEEFFNETGNFLSAYQALKQEIEQLRYQIAEIKASQYTEQEKAAFKEKVVIAKSAQQELRLKIKQLEKYKLAMNCQAEITKLTQDIPILKTNSKNKSTVAAKEKRLKALEHFANSDYFQFISTIPAEISPEEKFTLLQIKITELDQTHSTLKTELTALEKNLEKIDKTISSLTEELSSIPKSNEQAYAEKNAEIEAAKKDKKQFETQIEEKKQQINQIDDLSKDLQFISNEILRPDQNIDLEALQKKYEQELKILEIEGEHLNIIADIINSKTIAALKKEQTENVKSSKENTAQIKKLKLESQELDLNIRTILESQPNPQETESDLRQLDILKAEGNKLSKKKLLLPKEKADQMDALKEKLKNILPDLDRIKKRKTAIADEIKKLEAENKKITTKIEETDNQILRLHLLKQEPENIFALEKELAKKEGLLKKIDISSVKPPEALTLPCLRNFQIEYDKANIEKQLKTFQKILTVADSNITIINAIVDFVTWQKEYCSEEMRANIEKIIPDNYLKDFRGFRNRAMHSLDYIDKLETTTSQPTKIGLEQAKNALLAMIACLQQENNLCFLKDGQAPNLIQPYAPINNQTFEDILPKLPDRYLPDGSEIPYGIEDQLIIFSSSIANAKAILTILNNELTTDNPSYPLLNIVSIMSKSDEKLNPDELKIKMKYDALLQALGQAIGNLQQYTILPEIGMLDIKIEDYVALREIVPQAKDYRSSRTHNGYYNVALLENILTNVDNVDSLKDALDKLYKTVVAQLKTTSSLKPENTPDDIAVSKCIIS